MGSRGSGNTSQLGSSGPEGEFYRRPVSRANAQGPASQHSDRVLCWSFKVVSWPRCHWRTRTEDRILAAVLGYALQPACRIVAESLGGDLSLSDVLPEMGQRTALQRSERGALRVL